MECIAAFNKDADAYDKWYREMPGLLIFLSELKAVQVLLPEGTGLEVGVGTGAFASRLKTGLGIDPALEMVWLSKKRGIDNLIQATAEYIPIKNGLLDYVLLLFTICFLEDPVTSLKEASRILRRKGSIILSFIPASSSWGRLCEDKKHAGHPLYCHARFYSLDKVSHMLQESGFKVTDGRATLMQPPQNFSIVEEPRPDLDSESKYGLIVLKAEKA
ncbi:class I SAM-dependent methyltransferase [Candidatus Bathyarchaeota archaeon]|jgi:ubiquinone/menaquinone biosynthesis C-methylase UbiE|nr:class I SAM-dependent methyltransferase [Candidatus Bathyarchaeota archaeon]